MEEYQARKPSPHPYQTSDSLAYQAYSTSEDEKPLEEEREERKVVKLPAKSRDGQAANISQDGVETSSPPRSPTKRKATGSSKGRTSSSKSKSTKPYRSAQATKQPFADELQYLEQLAERINQVLEERARKKAYLEQVQAIQAQSMRGMDEIDPRFAPPYPRSPMPPQFAHQSSPYEQPSLEEEDTESLKLQAKRIRHRLSQLEAMMDEEADGDEPVDFSAAYREVNWGSPYRDQALHQSATSTPVPPTGTNAASYPPPVYPPQSYAPRQNPFDPIRQRAEFESWRATEELHLLQHQEQWTYPETDRRDRPPRQGNFEPVLKQIRARLQRFPVGTFLEVPRRPMDWLNDAAMWVVLAAIARIASRYLVMAFPFLSPILTLMMIAPAGLAIFLALFMPKTGWISFYRLFLIMIGFLIGGKLF